MNLRPYQQQTIDDLKSSFRSGHRSVVTVLGCGGGKSCLAADIARSATARGNRVLFLVHRSELIDQISKTFAAWGVDGDLCDFFMIQTYRRHMKPPDYYKLIIIDEAHLFYNAYQSVVQHHASAHVVGFTATPSRLNQGGLGDIYTDMVQGVSTRWLIDNGYLADYRYYSVPLADTSRLRVKGGEFVQQQVAELMNHRHIYGNAVSNWERVAAGTKTIVYCASVEAAKLACDEFNAKGYSSVALDGTTPPQVRRDAVDAFRDGKLTVLCNCCLMGEGFDVPDCETVILLRPTQSLAVFVQQSMRSMRAHPSKERAIILDHVGNVFLHGLPDDDREWSLETKKRQEKIIKIRECSTCFAVLPPTMTTCPYCSEPLTTQKERKGRTTVDVDLVELQRAETMRNTPIRDMKFKTWEQIVEYQKARRMKFQWCLNQARDSGIEIPGKYRNMQRYLRRR